MDEKYLKRMNHLVYPELPYPANGILSSQNNKYEKEEFETQDG